MRYHQLVDIAVSISLIQNLNTVSRVEYRQTETLNRNKTLLNLRD